MQNVPETLYHAANEIDKGNIPKPRMAFLTPTYRCNQRCYYCFYKDWNNTSKIEQTNMIPHILENLKSINVKSIEFEGGGDPLVFDDIESIFKQAYNMGFKLGLLTNGVLFKDDVADTFLRLGNYVRISLDTVDPELYKKIRGTDDLPIVLQNLKNAVELKQLKKYKCEISIKVGISEYVTLDKIKDVYEYFEDFGLSNIQVKNLWNANGKHFRKDIIKSKLTSISKKHTLLIEKVMYSKNMAEQCWLTPVNIAVDVYGDVYICAYYMFRKESMTIGNLYDTPLSELWGSERHKEVILNIKKTECLQHDCRFQKYMQVIRKQQALGSWEFL